MDERVLRTALQAAGYVADERLATVVWLAAALQRPLLIEGDAGVGKTALAAALARALGHELVRLQCYEGLDLAQAAYEWNYSRQLIEIRLRETQGAGAAAADLFGRDYLLARPLLRAIDRDQRCVLLIDEIDRADEGFEAFLLEVLSEYQISIPELGTIKAAEPPLVLLTSNGSRELSDALRRRCLYHFQDYPTLGREIEIVRLTLPYAEQALVDQAVSLVQALRREDLQKRPGIAETLDWIAALHRLGVRSLDDDDVRITDTLACLLKTRGDRRQVDASSLRRLGEGAPIGVAEALRQP